MTSKEIQSPAAARRRLGSGEARFGSERSSEGIEEWIIRDFFNDRRDGVFVDVGTNHFKKHSNTYFLETALNWSGIAVEPLTAFAEEDHVDDLLDAECVESFQFMSMDIELAEPKALAGLDIRRFRPELVGIEAHPEVRQQILDYFTVNGYVVLGRYLRADQRNLWFAPLAHSPGH
jgi:hypothetical protein